MSNRTPPHNVLRRGLWVENRPDELRTNVCARPLCLPNPEKFLLFKLSLYFLAGSRVVGNRERVSKTSGGAMLTLPAQVKTHILEAIASYRDEMLEFSKVLMSIPTENPPGRCYRQCAELIAGKLGEIGLESTLLPVPDAPASSLSSGQEDKDERRYCVQSFYGPGQRTLYFHGHYDVVPAASPAQFQPYVERGNLFGRGSSDMKCGLAAMIYAVRAIKECGIELDGRIGLAIVPDEETGGAGGSQYLVEAGLLGKDGIGMLMPEPTSGVIWNASRGAVSLRVTVKGKPAHVGLQHQGINAFERMLAVANALQQLKAEVESRKTHFRITPQAAQRSILLMGGRCEGGTNFNLVPGECHFTVDRRINPEEDFETEKHRLLDLLDGLREGGIDLAIDVFQEGRAAGFSENDPVARTLAHCAREVTGKEPAFALCPGLLEIRFYAQQGIPAFAYGPGLLSVSHGPAEFVKLEDVYRCSAVYALTAVRLLSSP